jgi:hypothetical protein
MQMYDPKTKTVTTIDTCFGTHHLNFDDNDVLWFTGGGPVEGWFDTRVYDKTKDEQKAQGWTVFVLDTNGNGKRDAYVEPDQPIDPTKDKRINAPFYGVAPTPGGDGIWGSVQGMPGSLVRLTLGSNPPETALSEIYEVPWKNPKASAQGFAPRGVGKDVPLATGNGSEGLLALVDGKFMTFRVPYPMGFYAKGIDGRIDDAKAGWKGKGIWTTYATRAPFHAEGGKGTTSKLVKFQVRNSPLDK